MFNVFHIEILFNQEIYSNSMPSNEFYNNYLVHSKTAQFSSLIFSHNILDELCVRWALFCVWMKLKFVSKVISLQLYTFRFKQLKFTHWIYSILFFLFKHKVFFSHLFINFHIILKIEFTVALFHEYYVGCFFFFLLSIAKSLHKTV